MLTEDSRTITSITLPYAFTDFIFLKNNKCLGYGNYIRVWDMVEGHFVKFVEKINVIHYVIELKDGNIATCSNDSLIRIWDVKSLKCLAVLRGHKKMINSIIQLENGNIASGSDDETIRIWSLEGHCVKTIYENMAKIKCIINLVNGDFAYVSGYSIHICSMDGEKLKVIETEYKMKVISQLLNGDICGTADLGFATWNLKGKMVKMKSFKWTCPKYLVLDNGDFAVAAESLKNVKWYDKPCVIFHGTDIHLKMSNGNIVTSNKEAIFIFTQEKKMINRLFISDRILKIIERDGDLVIHLEDLDDNRVKVWSLKKRSSLKGIYEDIHFRFH